MPRSTLPETTTGTSTATRLGPRAPPAGSRSCRSKYEEIYPPEVNSFVYICANTYSREALLTAEKNVLLALDYKLSSPLAWHFLNWVGRRVRLNRDELHLAQFFLELTLQEREFTPFPRSLVAASAINLACKIKRCDQEKVDHAIRESEYSEEEIITC